MLPYLHTLGTCTYNAVLAWLVKKAEDNPVELPFIYPVGVLVFQFSREAKAGKSHNGDALLFMP